MAEVRKGYFHLGFFQTFVVPIFLVFLLPGLSFAFFYHAQSTLNARLMDAIVQQVEADQSVTPEERQEAIEFYKQVPFSRLIREKEFSDMVDAQTRFNFFTFRWMMILSFLSIVCGILYFMFAGVSVVLSYNSQRIQHLVLAFGWPLLKNSARLPSYLAKCSRSVASVVASPWLTS